MIRIFRNSLLLKCFVIWAGSSMLLQLFAPSIAYALTSGPSQPEFSSFEPIGTSEMVDLSSGNFVYNVVLPSVRGYPLSASYHAGGSPEGEATMIGYGWNINIGQLGRNQRGLPDEFRGEIIRKEFYKKPNKTVGLGLSLDAELASIVNERIYDDIVETVSEEGVSGSLSFSVMHNSYTGIGSQFGQGLGYSYENSGLKLNLNGNLSYSSKQGFTITPSAGLGYQIENSSSSLYSQEYSANISGSLNSRQGLQFTMGVGAQLDVAIQPGLGFTFKPSGSISFAGPATQPRFSLPYTTSNEARSVKFGIELPPLINPRLGINTFIQDQRLSRTSDEISAYGTFHQEEGTLEDGALVDFHRIMDPPGFIQGVTPNLGIPQATYDVYTAMGQGVAGSFRPYTSQLIQHADPAILHQASEVPETDIGFEFGGGNLLKLGADYNINMTNAWASKWEASQGNRLAQELENDLTRPRPEDYEPFYFKSLGERAVELDNQFYQNIGNEKAVSIPITNGHLAKNQFQDRHGTLINPSPNASSAYYRRDKRARRNQHMSFLTAEEATHAGLEKEIHSFPLFHDLDNHPYPFEPQIIPRESEYRVAHHPSEFRVQNPDGNAYVYGVPAYITEHVEKTFDATNIPYAVDPSAPNDAPYLVNYTPGTHDELPTPIPNTPSDQHFESVETPPWAHSYLLTGVLSPDYEDVLGDGITDDDRGNAYKINYTRVYQHLGYRGPTHEPDKEPAPTGPQLAQATLNEGLKSDPYDDKASLIYGTKEYWLPHSIEHEKEVAIFVYENRPDGLGPIDINGRADLTQPLKRLKKIIYFAKEELLKHDVQTATPLQTVHFDYHDPADELFQGVPNRDGAGGKATLKSISFTSGKSGDGKLTPYRFEYEANPAYEPKGQDRWGTYMPANANSDLPAWEYPYTDQRVIDPSDPQERHADVNARAYQLSSIFTPSGSEIQVSYEADDYAFVKGDRAMQMVKILGVGPDASTMDPEHFLYRRNQLSFDQHHYLFVELPIAATSDADFKQRYLRDMDELYINAFLDLNNEDNFERVGGFVGIENGGLVSGSNGLQAWIQMKPIGRQDDGGGRAISHLARLGMSFTRAYRQVLIYPASSPLTTDADILDYLMGPMLDIQNWLLTPNGSMQSRGFSQEIDPDKSWTRLYSPDGFTHGGGHRVARIELSDNWDSMGNGVKANYGQVYEYTTENPDNPGEIISSGVATSLPIIGEDENSDYGFKTYTRERAGRGVADDVHRLIKPLMRSLNPAPQVIYSKVKVSGLPKSGVVQHGTGHEEYGFFTAKDYPTYTEETLPDEEVFWLNLVLLGLGTNFHTVSQGYAIYLNDMPGKPHYHKVYQTGKDQPVSGQTYTYRSKMVDTQDGQIQALDNDNIKVLSPSGSISTNTMGVDIDMAIDSREQVTITEGFSIQGNIDASSIPIPIPIIIPSSRFQQDRFRSLVTAKTIRKAGILESVTVFDGNAEITTKNLAYDAETGAVVLTETTNSFNDPIYQFSYLSNWAYDESMGLVYQNQGIELQNVVLNNITNAEQYFVPGDEILLDDELAWVLEVRPGELEVINREGALVADAPATGSYGRLKIIRSGRSNQAMVPIGSVVSKSNPLEVAPLGSDYQFGFEKVLDASATRFSTHWPIPCGQPLAREECDCEVPQAMQDMIVLLDHLAGQGVLNPLPTNPPVDLSQEPLFTTNLAAAIMPPGYSCAPLLKASALSNYGADCASGLKIEIYEDCNPTQNLYELTLTAPASNFLCLEFISVLDNFQPTQEASGCQDSDEFTLDGTITYCGNGADDVIQLHGIQTGLNAQACTPFLVFENHCVEPGAEVNPFLYGIEGDAAPVATYAYFTGRSFTNTGTTAPTPLMPNDLREDGVFASTFTPAWRNTNGEWSFNDENWTTAAEITKRIPQGFDVESKNPLDIYSAAQYGYTASLPVARIVNARNYEMANVNFEVANDIGTHCEAHVQVDGIGYGVSDAAAHTGFQSGEVSPGKYMYIASELKEDDCTAQTAGVPYLMDECDCVGHFQPSVGKTYRFAYWQYMPTLLSNPAMDYPTASIEIYLGGIQVPNAELKLVKSKLVDAWQMVEGTLEIPASGIDPTLEIRFQNNDATRNLYIDDIVFHPFNSEIQTWVYHPDTDRLLAAGGASHFYQKFQYTVDGKLTGIKQESERGFITIQTGESYLAPNL